MADIDIVCGRYGASVADMVCGRYRRFPLAIDIATLNSKKMFNPTFVFVNNTITENIYHSLDNKTKPLFNFGQNQRPEVVFSWSITGTFVGWYDPSRKEKKISFHVSVRVVCVCLCLIINMNIITSPTTPIGCCVFACWQRLVLTTDQQYSVGHDLQKNPLLQCDYNVSIRVLQEYVKTQHPGNFTT